MNPRTMRRNFAKGLVAELRVVWPILSGLIGALVALGVIVGLIEGWSVRESIYFGFTSGLTIGYGDLTPKTALSRVFAILIGFCGVLLMGLWVAIGVEVLRKLDQEEDRKDDA